MERIAKMRSPSQVRKYLGFWLTRFRYIAFMAAADKKVKIRLKM